MIAPELETRRFRVIGLVVWLFYMIGKIVFSIENCTTEGETPLHKAGFVRRFVILG